MITFSQAMDDANIFRRYFRDPETWQAWRVLAKVLFGERLSDAEMAIYNECCQRSDTPPEGFDELWCCIGRRGGKSLMMALIAVYLAAFYDYRKYLQPGEMGTLACIASDRRQARLIHRYISAAFNEIPILKQLIKSDTAESIELHNNVAIEIVTASYRAARGYTLIAAICDEIAYFHSDESSRNPDSEIIAAIRPGLSTVPGAKLLCISSPYARKGELWEHHKRYYGVTGADVLVWQAASRTMNPTLKQSIVDRAMEADPEKARSEYLAQFRSDIASFVDRQAVEACVDRGVRERPFVAGNKYRAFCDPSGGSNDSFTLAIAHSETVRGTETVIIDALREIAAPFVPTDAVKELANVLKSYRLRTVHGDKYAMEWCRQAWRDVGIEYRHSELTRSEIYLEALPLINSKKIKLLDHPKALNQLCNLERRTSRSGKDSVDHAPGGHDDVANSLCGAATLLTAALKTFSVDHNYEAKLNPDNWITMEDGTRKFQPPPRIVAHPEKGLPRWMREESYDWERTTVPLDEPGRLW